MVQLSYYYVCRYISTTNKAIHVISETKNQTRMAMMIASLVLLLLPNKLHSQSSDTTAFNFNNFAGNEAELIYQGTAYIPPAGDRPPGVEQGQTFVRLTETYFHPPPPPIPFWNRVGRVLYAPPIRLWDAAGRRQANFQTVIRGYIGNYKIFEPEFNLGDGMSFFIAPAAVNSIVPIPPSSTNGHMGLYDASGRSPTPLLAVELDVDVNSWDPNFVHVGININNRTSVTVARWQDEVAIGGESHIVLEARITYDARQRLLIVVVNSTNGRNPAAAAPMIARLEYTYDLKTLLPEWVQIGISASTSEIQRPPGIFERYVTALHEVRGWSFISFMEADDDVVQDT